MARSMDVVANNIANATTTGFKREDTVFNTFIPRPAAPKDRIEFAVDKGTFRDTAAGPTLNTGNPLDLAIQGEGYFPIQSAAGTMYTRGGAFQLNDQGEIVTASGERLLGDGDQPITLPSDASDILISSDGVVTAKSGTDKEALQAGKIKLVKFADEQELQPVGNGLYKTAQQPEAETSVRVVQGALENSNVKSVIEITDMIGVMRSYQMAARLIDLDNQRQTGAIARLFKTNV